MTLAALEAELHTLQARQQEAQHCAAEQRAELDSVRQQLQAEQAEGDDKSQLVSSLQAERAAVQETMRRLRGLYERQVRQEVERAKTVSTSSAQHGQLLVAKEQQLLSLQSTADELRAELSAVQQQREQEREAAACRESALLSVLEVKLQRREEELATLDGLFDCVAEEREREKAERLQAQARLSQTQTMLYQSIGQVKQLQQSLRATEAAAEEAKAAAAGREKEVDYWKACSEDRQRKKQELILDYSQQQTEQEQSRLLQQEAHDARRREWEQQSRDWQRQLAEREERLSELNQETAELQTRCLSLQHQLKLSTAAVEHDAEIIAAQAASLSSSQQAAAAGASRVRMLEEIIEVQSAVMREKDAALLSIQSRLQGHSAAAEAMSQRELRLSGSLSWAAQQVSSLADSFSALEQKLQVKEAEIGAKEEETLILCSQLQLTQAENAALARCTEQMRAERESMDALLSHMQRELTAVQQARQEELQVQDRLHSALEQEKTELRTELEALAREIAAYTAERSEESRAEEQSQRRVTELLLTVEHQQEVIRAKDEAVRKAKEDGAKAARDAEDRADGEVRLFQLALMEKATTIDSQSLEIPPPLVRCRRAADSAAGSVAASGPSSSFSCCCCGLQLPAAVEQAAGRAGS